MDTFDLDAPDLVDQFYADAPAGRGGGGGTAFAYNLVWQTDKTIARNNRLAMMIEIHGKRQGRLANKPVHQEMEEQPVATKKVGNCEVCDRTKTTVVSVYNKKMCLPCSNAYSAVNVRPEIVMEAIKEIGLTDKFIATLGTEMVPVHVESSALKAIAEIVGYGGEDEDQLLEAVRELRAENGDLRIFLNQISAQVSTQGSEYAAVVDRVRQLALEIDDCRNGICEHALPLDLIKALDCTADDWEMVAIQTAALLKQALGKHIQDCTTIKRQACDIGGLAQGADRMREQLDRIKEEYTMTVDRLQELEQQHSQHLQVFAQLADLVQGNPEYPAELPSRFAALLRPQPAGLVPLKINVQEKMRDTFLLDLAIDALRGNVTGLDPQWIAMMREVA